MLCDWTTAPVQENLKATVDCFLGDSEGKPASLPSTPTWKATYPGPAVLTSVLVNQGISITITGKTLVEVNKGLQDMQVSVSYGEEERTVTGRDILKPGAGEWRFAASCQNSFLLISINSGGSFTNNSGARFDGCETLASALTNITVPNSGFRALPDLHKTVGGSCNNGLFVLTIDPSGSTINLGGLSNQACLDLSSFVNTLAL
ncbi:hypothetical protein [Oligoflexus sp.]|uniref:hypothetical protein n=1 Tax=Oligoflexus sp. TaxID=1971216 RepID=UPI002D76970A|nr:hypothetical protein [Oligoflexus sp.]